MAERTLRELVHLAADGDRAAWEDIVARHAGLVWNVARAHRLADADAADVSQTVWLRLVENLGRIREPDALAGWLATTTRHETLRLLRRSGREVPDEDGVEAGLADRASREPGAEDLVLREERHTTLWGALDTLSPKCRLLLRALASVQSASYVQVAAALDMPIGSIGPTRARCLHHLRTALAGVDLASAD